MMPPASRRPGGVPRSSGLRRVTRRMRILLANKFLYPKGGAERAVLALGGELARRGHAVSWFGMEHPENAIRSPDRATVPERDYHRPGPRRFADALAMVYSLQARRRF